MATARERRGTIWWDFDGTLASRPRMWSEAGIRFLRHTFPEHPIAVGRLRAALSSASVGYEKPHARMFEAALAHSITGAPIWMIGDNLEADCIPAASFGARAILVRTEASFERRVGNLWDALALIQQSDQHAI